MLEPSSKVREELIEFLKGKGIMAVFHFRPLHMSPMFVTSGARTSGSLAVTEELCDCVLRLPSYHAMTESDVDSVIEALEQFFGQK